MSARPKSTLRYELKYLIRRPHWSSFIRLLSEHLPMDEHGDAEGRYPITSLYYDSAAYRAYWDKLEGHRYRRKVRVRVYGDAQVEPDTRCFVEVKERRNTRISKRRAKLAYADAETLAHYNELADVYESGDSASEQVSVNSDASEQVSVKEVLREVYYLYQTLQLEPACVVRYDRMAFEGHAQYPDLRVTLDTNLRARMHDLTLLSTGYANEQYVLSPEMAILEIKVNHSVPFWLTKMLGVHQCTFHRISKYCAALDRCGAIRARQRVIDRSELASSNGLR